MDLEEKRIKLFQKLRDFAFENDLGEDFDVKYPTFSRWEKVNFKNDATVLNLWDRSLKNILEPTSRKNFFIKFACDLLPNSTYCGGSGATQRQETPVVTPPQQSNVFGCIFKGDNRTKKTSDTKQVTINLDNQKWFFWNDGDFRVKEGNVKDTTTSKSFKGKWKCDGNDAFRINTDDGYSYSSKTKEWVIKSNSRTGGSSNTTTIKLSDIKNGTKSVKIGAKGSIVTNIQDLLIGLGYNDVSNSGKSDGNFGPKTDGMVKKYQKDNGLTDDGIVGAKTIAALLGGKSDATKVEPVVNTTQSDQIQGTDGYIIKEKEKLDILQESVKKLLRNSLLGFRKK